MAGGEGWRRPAYLAVTGASGLALVAAAVAGGLLTWRYEPGGPAAGLTETSGVRWSDRLSDTVDVALVVAVPLLVGWALLVAWRGAGGPGPSSGRHAVVLVAAVVAVLAVLVALQSTDVARWDRVVLDSTADGDLAGLWPAAFRDDVRFVVVGTEQYEPDSYARFVVVQLVAPFVALGALGIGAAASRRRPAAHPLIRSWVCCGA